MGGESVEAAGISFEVVHVPGHSPGHLAYYADGALFSGDVLFAGSVGRTDLPLADWDTLLESIRVLVERYPPETVVYSGHGPSDDAGGRAVQQPVPRGAAEQCLRRPRHARQPPLGAAGLAAGDRSGGGRLPPLRLPADRHAGIRGHRGLCTHLRRRLGRRAERDVHVRGSRRPLADATAGGDGTDRPRDSSTACTASRSR